VGAAASSTGWGNSIQDSVHKKMVSTILANLEGCQERVLTGRLQKRRPWTSFFDHLVGRGNLNSLSNKLIN
ncbi:hypothetical protein, partial [Pseudomonas brenneri]|uniref:hypothetical protein n=1 Tax=Pseudomonas brenneri TaxID=129817 RepID=UPI003BA1566F